MKKTRFSCFNSRRLVSLTLAITLLLGIAPVSRAEFQTAEGTAAHSLYFNLMKGFVSGATGYDYLTTIDYINTTTGIEGNTEEINPYTPPGNNRTTSDPWAYQNRFLTDPNNKNNYVKYVTSSYGLALSGANSKVWIKVQVPADGTYYPSANLYRVANNGAGNTRLTFCAFDPDTDTVGETLASSDVVYTGNNSLGSVQYARIGEEPLALSAGEYVFTCEALGGAKKAFSVVDGFGLDAVAMDVQAQPHEDTVEIGGTLSVPLQLAMQDGSTVGDSKISVSVDYSDYGISSKRRRRSTPRAKALH